METKIFLEKVLDDSGYYAVLGFKGEHTKQKFYDSIDAVVTASKNLDIEGYETYFGLATFETADFDVTSAKTTFNTADFDINSAKIDMTAATGDVSLTGGSVRLKSRGEGKIYLN